MTEEEFIVREAFDPYPAAAEPRATVLMLPGRGYTCDMSLLAWTTRALQESGWKVLQAGWESSAVPADGQGFIQEVARRLDELERPAGPVLIVAKSLGTLAAGWGAAQGYPAVWLTPVLDGPHAAPIRDYPADNLVVGGTADSLWRPGFRGTGRVLEIEGADHSLHGADWRASIRNHQEVASAVEAFAAELLSS